MLSETHFRREGRSWVGFVLLCFGFGLDSVIFDFEGNFLQLKNDLDDLKWSRFAFQILLLPLFRVHNGTLKFFEFIVSQSVS